MGRGFDIVYNTFFNTLQPEELHNINKSSIL